VQEHQGGKKIDMEENLQPKHCPNQYCTSEIHVCRFEEGPKLASLKSPINILWDADTKNVNWRIGKRARTAGE